MIISRHVTPGLMYVRRAEQAGYDYDATSLTQDSAWHTLDISAIVPANAKLVHLRIGGANANTGRFFRVATVGDTQAIRAINIATQAANIINESNGIIDCAGQHIAYWATTGAWASMRLTIMGWFL